jgi:hypothetical protein
VSKRTRRILWTITGLIALLLAGATWSLAARTRSQSILGQPIVLTGRGSAAELHQEPDPDSPIVAALVRGSTVVVLDQDNQDGQIWYLVRKGNMTPGWIPASSVSSESR